MSTASFDDDQDDADVAIESSSDSRRLAKRDRPMCQPADTYTPDGNRSPPADDSRTNAD
jgi:hypothetical protein